MPTDGRRAKQPSNPQLTWPARSSSGRSLAHALSAQGRYAEALDCVTSAREAYTASRRFDAAEVHRAGVPTAEALLGLGRHDEAAHAARDTITALTELFSPDHGCVRDARELLERATSTRAS
ncbi:hypothetical protein ACWGQ5_32585 [Streptomyces sp. NPDC055722]